jgi:hypothetical protein
MLSPKRVARFCLLAVIYYGLLVIPWPGAWETYRSGYIAVATHLFGQWSLDGQTRFDPLIKKERTREHDVRAILAKRGAENTAVVRFSTIRWGYLSTALTMALILATPIPWKRRLWALLWGLLLVNAFVIGRLFIMLLYCVSSIQDVQLYEPGPFWGRVLFEAYELLFRATTASFLVPILIWIFVALLRMPRPDAPPRSVAASGRRS